MPDYMYNYKLFKYIVHGQLTLRGFHWYKYY